MTRLTGSIVVSNIESYAEHGQDEIYVMKLSPSDGSPYVNLWGHPSIVGPSKWDPKVGP